jgi:hypothetical protein
VKDGRVTEALTVAREIKDSRFRMEALSVVASALAKVGLTLEALTITHEIEEAYHRAHALLAVADSWLGKGKAEDAWNLLEEVRGAISKVFNDHERSKAMRHLAIILARLHSYRAARETAEQCSRSEDRLDAYTAVIREYHIERDPSLAQLFAEEEEEED